MVYDSRWWLMRCSVVECCLLRLLWCTSTEVKGRLVTLKLNGFFSRWYVWMMIMSSGRELMMSTDDMMNDAYVMYSHIIWHFDTNDIGQSVIFIFFYKNILKKTKYWQRERFRVFAGSKSLPLDRQSFDVMNQPTRLSRDYTDVKNWATQVLSWSVTKHLPWCNSFRYESTRIMAMSTVDQFEEAKEENQNWKANKRKLAESWSCGYEIYPDRVGSWESRWNVLAGLPLLIQSDVLFSNISTKEFASNMS